MRNTFQLLRGAFQIFMGNPALFLGITALPLALSILTLLFEPNQATGVIDTTEWVVYMVIALVNVVFNILFGIALILAVDNRSLTVRATYKAARSFFWRYLGLSIVTGFILIFAFVLFIIPGIVVSVWFSFAGFVFVLEKAGIIESLKRSREYVKGKWWAVFFRITAMLLIILIVLAILLGLASWLANDRLIEDIFGTTLSMLLAPVGVGYIYLLYQDIKNGSVAAAPVQVTESPVIPNPPASM